MDKFDFDIIYDMNICKQVNHWFYSIKPQYVKEFNVRLADDNNRNDIKATYENIRNQLKTRYYNFSSENGNIDHHKIASCMCKSIIDNKPILFDWSLEVPSEIVLSNYKVAFMSSLGIVYMFMLDDYRTKDSRDSSELVKKLSIQKKLLFPKTYEGHDDYFTGKIKSLALNDMDGNDFDILMYSDIMFWIEHYNRQIIENKLEPFIENK